MSREQYDQGYGGGMYNPHQPQQQHQQFHQPPHAVQQVSRGQQHQTQPGYNSSGGGGYGGGGTNPQYGGDPREDLRRANSANRSSYSSGGAPGRPSYAAAPHRNSTPSIATDITSVAGYTLSGNQPAGFGGGEEDDDAGVGGGNAFAPRGLDQEHVKQLIDQGFSYGLAKALAQNADAFDRRIWVVDNSGSMQIGDGHRIVINGSNGKVEATPVTRWEEIQDTIIYHSQMAAVLQSPTIFRLLNDPGPTAGAQEFSVCNTPATNHASNAPDGRGGFRGAGSDVEQEIRRAKQIMQRAKPDGVTPLTQHIWEIQGQIRAMLPQLQQSGQRVAIILATDGLPTDDQGFGGREITEDFIKALRALEGLPIWLVIRLCTDEDKVTDFYNELDGRLELSLEVLDDFLGESKEVHTFNPWLNYSLPMHRCRELGYHDRLFDLIDERPLTKGELREFCVLLFGSELDAIPDPVSDWKDFLMYIQDQLRREMEQWNPIKKKTGPWISIKSLNRVYNGGKCSIM